MPQSLRDDLAGRFQCQLAHGQVLGCLLYCGPVLWDDARNESRDELERCGNLPEGGAGGVGDKDAGVTGGMGEV